MDKRPIGIFDSGLGGLTVVCEIRKRLPYEDIVYLGDTARVPYGTRSKETVTKFAKEDVEFLKKQDVKCIVIACNTASALAQDEVRKSVEVPVFDVISAGSRNAIQETKNRKIGVIGTRATIGSKAYQNFIHKKDRSISVLSYPCPLLVPLIEEGEIKGQILDHVLEKYLKPLKGKLIDTLILACTHYPIISLSIKAKLKGVVLINPGEFLAKDVFLFLNHHNLSNNVKNKGEIRYFVTDLTDKFISTAEMFLGEKVNGRIQKVNLG